MLAGLFDDVDYSVLWGPSTKYLKAEGCVHTYSILVSLLYRLQMIHG